MKLKYRKKALTPLTDPDLNQEVVVVLTRKANKLPETALSRLSLLSSKQKAALKTLRLGNTAIKDEWLHKAEH